MAENEKSILTELAEKVSGLDDAGREMLLLCATAYAAGKAAGEKSGS